MKKLIFIISLGVFVIALKVQIPAGSDANWRLNTYLSNEFNDAGVDPNLWYIPEGRGWGRGHPSCPSYGTYTSRDQVTFDGNNITFTAEQINSDPIIQILYDMVTGFIISNNDEYLYGFYEIRTILPGYYEGGNPYGYGFQPEFWLYFQPRDANNCIINYDEIDIVEPSGNQFAQANQNCVGIHDYIGGCDDTQKYGHHCFTSSTPFFEDYHTFGAELFPDRVIFYFDDNPISYLEESDIEHIPDSPMRLVIGFQVDWRINNGILPSSTLLPQTMIVDYFRYYELNFDNCNLDVTILTNSQLNNFEFGVRKNINIGNGSSSISLDQGDNVTFRATESTFIEGDFTVPLGSEFNVIPTICN
ncbi:MAG: family 16 glycosylhydrolase [Bacteroidales bacterium]|nr:family 16 glycosylhydrolase [Bacteroidales bacterium]